MPEPRPPELDDAMLAGALAQVEPEKFFLLTAKLGNTWRELYYAGCWIATKLVNEGFAESKVAPLVQQRWMNGKYYPAVMPEVLDDVWLHAKRCLAEISLELGVKESTPEP